LAREHAMVRDQDLRQSIATRARAVGAASVRWSASAFPSSIASPNASLLSWS
jgi:hypothetical protein